MVKIKKIKNRSIKTINPKNIKIIKAQKNKKESGLDHKSPTK
jgi:hypothetical protein